MPGVRRLRSTKAATATLLVLAMFALAIAGCGSDDSGADGGTPSDAATSADDGEPKTFTDEEREAADPEMLAAVDDLRVYAGDLTEDTVRLVKNEQKRAERVRGNLEYVEDIGREQIEYAREKSRTWSAEDDPLCTEAAGWPPDLGYESGYSYTPPYDTPFDWRMEFEDKVRGVNHRDVADARVAIERVERASEEHPGDPLVDESETIVTSTQKAIADAKEELAEGEGIQEQIAAQEERNEDLYAEWEREYDEDLYNDIAC